MHLYFTCEISAKNVKGCNFELLGRRASHYIQKCKKQIFGNFYLAKKNTNYLKKSELNILISQKNPQITQITYSPIDRLVKITPRPFLTHQICPITSWGEGKVCCSQGIHCMKRGPLADELSVVSVSQIAAVEYNRSSSA